jgi:hypothetical protein
MLLISLHLLSNRPISQKYEETLISLGIMDSKETGQFRTEQSQLFESSLNISDDHPAHDIPSMTEYWTGTQLAKPADFQKQPMTGLDLDKLRQIGEASVKVPGEIVCLSFWLSHSYLIDSLLGSSPASHQDSCRETLNLTQIWKSD